MNRTGNDREGERGRAKGARKRTLKTELESKKQRERERERAFFTLPFKENFLKPVDRETNK